MGPGAEVRSIRAIGGMRVRSLALIRTCPAVSSGSPHLTAARHCDRASVDHRARHRSSAKFSVRFPADVGKLARFPASLRRTLRTVTPKKPWNEKSPWGTTRAYGEWRAIDRDSRVFLDLTTTVMAQRFEALWAEIGARPGDPDGPDQIDIFDHEVKIQPTDYFWMLGAAVLRDAVTAFDVYLEEVGSELRHDWKMKPGWSPPFDKMAEYFDSELGLDVGTAQVK